MNEILINGDVSTDHFLGIGNRPFSDSPANQTGSFDTQMTGGAYLVYDLLKKLVSETDQVLEKTPAGRKDPAGFSPKNTPVCEAPAGV